MSTVSTTQASRKKRQIVVKFNCMPKENFQKRRTGSVQKNLQLGVKECELFLFLPCWGVRRAPSMASARKVCNSRVRILTNAAGIRCCSPSAASSEVAAVAESGSSIDLFLEDAIEDSEGDGLLVDSDKNPQKKAKKAQKKAAKKEKKQAKKAKKAEKKAAPPPPPPEAETPAASGSGDASAPEASTPQEAF
jgi:hypothetical protein